MKNKTNNNNNNNNNTTTNNNTTNNNNSDIDIDNELTENTPETRVKIYRELAEQKKEKSDRDKVNEPKSRDYELEHQASLQEVRSKESTTKEEEIKQKNEGEWFISMYMTV